jgi:hypothetical protein
MIVGYGSQIVGCPEASNKRLTPHQARGEMALTLPVRCAVADGAFSTFRSLIFKNTIQLLNKEQEFAGIFFFRNQRAQREEALFRVRGFHWMTPWNVWN